MRWNVWNSDAVTQVPWKAQIIDTTYLSPIDVAGEVLSWVKGELKTSSLGRANRPLSDLMP
jgi:hypothetical protein